jgi:hypothetical protein
VGDYPARFAAPHVFLQKENVMDATKTLVRKSRLIVLIPESLAGNTNLAHEIHRLALREGRNVFYLALVDDVDNRLVVLRDMATMKAATSDQDIVVEISLTDSGQWLHSLKDLIRTGDMIVCHAEQVVKGGFLRTIPLNDYLKLNFPAPVRMLSHYYHPLRTQARQWLNGILFWLGSLMILALFFFLEIRTDQIMPDPVRVTLLSLLMIGELGVLLTWSLIVKKRG